MAKFEVVVISESRTVYTIDAVSTPDALDRYKSNGIMESYKVSTSVNAYTTDAQDSW